MESTIKLLESLAEQCDTNARETRAGTPSVMFNVGGAGAYRHAARLIREHLDALAAERADCESGQ